jgi:AcrR family transcriptional regulator
MSDVKTGRREMYAALTRAAVLDAATQLFVEKGFDETSIDDIARVSQTSKGAVYHHFPDKREIFAAVFTASELAVIDAALQSTPEHGSSPWDRLKAATTAFLRSYVEDTTARALLRQVMGALGWERVRAIDEETALPMIRASLGELMPTDNATFPVATAAELLFGLYCNGILHIAGSDDPSRASTEVETVIFAMLRGLQA